MNRVRSLSLGIGVSWLVALLDPPATPQVYTPTNPGPDGTDYVVAPLAANCVEDYRVYLPSGTAPPAGWPVLIHLDLSDFLNTVDFQTINTDAPETDLGWQTQHLLGRVLNSGVAVITARATPSREFDDALWTTMAPDGTPALCPPDPAPSHATMPGHGMFHPPGATTLDACCMPPPDTGCIGGSDATVEPYALPEWSMAEKDAMMLVQHVRYGARQATGDLAVLDHRRIALHASSSGAAAAMWAAFGPDRRAHDPLPKDYLGQGSQYDESTRPDAAVLEHGMVWWPLYVDTAGGYHFGDGGDADCPAPHKSDILPEELRGGSALYYEDTALNATLPLLLAYNQTNVDDPLTDCWTYCKTFTVPPPPCEPFTIACENFATNAHARWNGFAWKLLYPQRTQLVIWRPDLSTPVVPYDEKCPGPPCLSTGACIAFDDTIVGLDALQDKIVAWLQTNLVQPAPAVWFTIQTAKPGNEDCLAPVTVGFAPPGGAIPQLAGTGTFVPGTQVRMKVTGAIPNSPAALYIGFGNDVAPNGDSNAPLKGRPCVAWPTGGIFVPSPNIMLGPATVGINGTVTFQFTWPASSHPLAERYYQVWLQEPGGGAFYSTNALMSRAP